LQITVTLCELAIGGSGGHVIITANEIICVKAVVWGGNRVEASFEAELVATNESIPVEDLGEGNTVGISGSIGEDDAA
jgi:hypothetical protein